MEPVYVTAFDIPAAWAKVVDTVYEKGVRQKTQAYDDYARTVYNLLVYIMRPATRPLSCFSAGYSEKMLYTYFGDYFFIGEESGHEHNYGNRLHTPFDQFQAVADMLIKCPHTRRAIMLIARPEDLSSKFAPCVRELNFYMPPPNYDTLCTTVFVRSWDVYAAGNPDLASFQLAAEVVSRIIKEPTGSLTVLATNAHIYKKSLEYLEIKKKDGAKIYNTARWDK